MSEPTRAEFVTRDTIMKLLSNEEIAKISSAEAASGLTEGAEYLDLQHLDLGVQRSHALTKVAIGHVLPKGAVSEKTWSTVVAELAH